MKKHLIIVAVLVLAVAGVGYLAINKYNHRPTKPSYAQVSTERYQALVALQAQRSVNANNKTAIANLTTSNASLTDTNAKLCAQIKAARLVQPLCK